MADITDFLLKGASEGAAQTGKALSEGIRNAAELAKRNEELQLKQQQLELAKQKILQAKIDKFSQTLLSVEKVKSPQARRLLLKKFIPRQRDALGLQGLFDDDSINFIGSSDENLLRLKTLISKLQRGEITFTDYAEAFRNMEKFLNVDIDPQFLDEGLVAENKALQRDFEFMKLREQQQFAQKEKQKARAAQLSKELTKIVPLANTSVNLFKLIKKYEGKNIPGVGGKEGLLPLGKLKGDAARIRQLTLGIANNMVKDITGANIRESEVPRILGQLGFTLAPTEGGGFKPIFNGIPSEDVFRQGIRDVVKFLRDKTITLERGFGTPAERLNPLFKELKSLIAEPVSINLPNGKLITIDPNKYNKLTEKQKDALAVRLGLSKKELDDKLGRIP